MKATSFSYFAVLLIGSLLQAVRAFAPRRTVSSSSRPFSSSSSSSSLPVPSITRIRRASSSSSSSSASSSSASLARDDDDGVDDASHLRRRKRALTREFLSIAGPAVLQLAAEPLAGIVDTAYLGRLGPEVLGGAGVAVSAHYAVSKLYNDPLLRTTISLIAAQTGTTRTGEVVSAEGEEEEEEEDAVLQDASSSSKVGGSRDLSIAVSSALSLAVAVGCLQMAVYAAFCRGITAAAGASPGGAMWGPAVSYLRVRALGTPAATLWLVANGVFRGLGDTRTPLAFSLLFTVLNAALDPVFIFGLRAGAAGAAWGTALAQYAALIPLLAALHRRVPLLSGRAQGQWGAFRACLRRYVSAGGLIVVRTVGKVLAYSVCARRAALLGSVAAAAYNLTFQLGFATTQVCEGVAIAVQTLVARSMSRGADRRLLRHLIRLSLFLGGGVATALSLLTYARRDVILAGLTTHVPIREACKAVFPVVLLTQVLKGLAYPVNGVIMGGLDWTFSTAKMWLANAACLGLLRYFSVTNVSAGGGGGVTLGQIWVSLAVFFATQVVAGIVRYESKTGVWKVLRRKEEDGDETELQAVAS